MPNYLALFADYGIDKNLADRARKAGKLKQRACQALPLPPMAQRVVRPSSVMELMIVQTSSGSIRNVRSLSNVTRAASVAPSFRINRFADRGPRWQSDGDIRHLRKRQNQSSTGAAALERLSGKRTPTQQVSTASGARNYHSRTISREVRSLPRCH